jgi:hypothetical protein
MPFPIIQSVRRRKPFVGNPLTATKIPALPSTPKVIRSAARTFLGAAIILHLPTVPNVRHAPPAPIVASARQSRSPVYHTQHSVLLAPAKARVQRILSVINASGRSNAAPYRGSAWVGRTTFKTVVPAKRACAPLVVSLALNPRRGQVYIGIIIPPQAPVPGTIDPLAPTNGDGTGPPEDYHQWYQAPVCTGTVWWVPDL